MERVTFNQICRVEPKLWDLFNLAVEIRCNRGKRFYPDTIWYDRLKPKLVDLVGFMAEGEGLIKSCEAYEVAYDTIYGALNGHE